VANLAQFMMIGSSVRMDRNPVAGLALTRLDRSIQVSTRSFEGYGQPTSIKDVASDAAAALLPMIGDVLSAKKVAAYFSVVPRSRQCTIIALRCSPSLKDFYICIRGRRGSGRTNIGTAGKLPTIYDTIKNVGYAMFWERSAAMPSHLLLDYHRRRYA